MSLEVIAQAPFDGPLTVSVGGCRHALGRQVAEQIFVMVEAPQADRTARPA
jgi:Fe2+ transport system protein FeoA